MEAGTDDALIPYARRTTTSTSYVRSLDGMNGRWRGLAVTRWSRSTKLPYAGPG